jgi:outer membrane protein
LPEPEEDNRKIPVKEHRMRKALFLAIIISLVTVVSAQAAEVKLGIFNSRAVAANSEPFTSARKKIESQYMPEKKKLDAQAQGLQKQADDLQKQRSAMSREALTEKSDAFMRAKRNFEDASQSYTRKVEAALIRLDQEFGARMFQAAQDYGMRTGLTALIDTAAGGIIYSDKSVDVTEELVKEVARVYREGKPIPGQPK